MNVGDTMYYRDGRDHVYQTTFQGETSRSWITGGNYHWNQSKLPKKTTVLVTQQDFEQFQWVQKHKYNIANAVRVVNNFESLKKIAELAGYKEQP